jgi:hypothetical protein
MKCKACDQELDDNTRLSEIPCGHIFHHECLMKRYYNRNSDNLCPQCHQNFFMYNICHRPFESTLKNTRAKYIFITNSDHEDFCSDSECEYQSSTLHVHETDITDPDLLTELQNMKIGSEMIHKWTNTYVEVIIVNDHGEILPIVHHLTKFLPKSINSGTSRFRYTIQKIYRLL